MPGGTILKRSLVAVLVISTLFALLGASVVVSMFLREHVGPVALGGGYRYLGREGGMAVIDRGYASEAEQDRAMRIWDENDRKGLDVDPDDIGLPRVGPVVDGFRVYPSVIAGHVSAPARNLQPDLSRRSSEPGYFVIDTRRNEVSRGLSHRQWRTELRKHGIAKEPKLHE